MKTCLICQDEFQKQSSFKCTNLQCNIYICNSCIHTWDIMYPRLECPVCHTSREKPDIENQTQVELRINDRITNDRITNNNTTERTIRRSVRRTIRRSVRENQIYPLQTIGMSSRGRTLFMITSSSLEDPTFIDRYCDYVFNDYILCIWKCCQTFHCILLMISITIIIGFIWTNFIYVIDNGDSIKNFWNETKDNYLTPDYYFILSINGVCVLSFICLIIGCCSRACNK